MKNLKCECCGAPLPIPQRYQKYIKCSYCDATYEIENYENITPEIETVKYILKEPGHLQHYCATIAVEEEKMKYYPPEVLEKYVKDELAAKLANLIKETMELRETYDIKNFARVYRADILIDTKRYSI